MSKKGIVLDRPDAHIEAKAKSSGLGVIVDPGLPFAFEKTLFVQAGTRVPWDLLSAAWYFLERWDAAIPLWRYGTNASQVGTAAERKRTKAIVRDLRVPLHACELLFVRKNEDGQALVEAWREELAGSEERRLAFLRALYRVKPRCCVLPTTWLADVRGPGGQGIGPRLSRRPRGRQLATVEIAPGQFVQCNPDQVEEVRAQFAAKGRRRG